MASSSKEPLLSWLLSPQPHSLVLVHSSQIHPLRERRRLSPSIYKKLDYRCNVADASTKNARGLTIWSPTNRVVEPIGFAENLVGETWYSVVGPIQSSNYSHYADHSLATSYLTLLREDRIKSIQHGRFEGKGKCLTDFQPPAATKSPMMFSSSSWRTWTPPASIGLARIRYLVMQFHHLRYKFELALAGMADGTLLTSKRPPLLRLQLLLTYRKEWSRLHWTGEQRVKLPVASTLSGVAGDFIYYVAGPTLELLELPSTRLNRPPSQTRHLRFNTNPTPISVAIDPSQSLIVVGHALGAPAGQLAMRLKIRNLWNFDKHPHARDAYFDFLAPLAQPLLKMTMSICGNKIAVSLRCAGGVAKQLLLDWNSFQATWMDELDVHFVGMNYLLGTKIYRNKALVHLYNVTNLSKVILEREYELPPHWAQAALSFAPNASLTGDAPSPTRALFYADASTRVLLLSAQQPGEMNGPQQWLIINESYFRPTNRPDRQFVPWAEWNHYCLMKNLPPSPLVRNVQVIGNRVLYLESNLTPGGHARDCRLGLIEFPAYPDAQSGSKGSWFHVGQRSVLIPTESFKEISSRITQGVGIEDIAATEDNIVIFSAPQHDTKNVHLMTFAVPSS
ncbi:hypothetical protein NMY22_g4953 [Coprinellus aureogranulatus]|nr:hypothetical protein NMY22_g4953 [Coprinellus aureogranulatus]